MKLTVTGKLYGIGYKHRVLEKPMSYTLYYWVMYSHYSPLYLSVTVMNMWKV